MRKGFYLLLLLVGILFITSCDYCYARKTYYTDISDYESIWSLSGFYYGNDYEDKTVFFPESIENSDVKEFFCRYDELLPLGEDIQIYLEILYDKNSFDTELSRLKTLSFVANEYFDLPGMSVLATKVDEPTLHANISEYAIIDNASMTIKYIILYGTPKVQIEFENEYVPINYCY